MLKIWLVKFSNGEEWHVFGERYSVFDAAHDYWTVESITYLRWVKA